MLTFKELEAQISWHHQKMIGYRPGPIDTALFTHAQAVVSDYLSSDQVPLLTKQYVTPHLFFAKGYFRVVLLPKEG